MSFIILAIASALLGVVISTVTAVSWLKATGLVFLTVWGLQIIRNLLGR